MWRLRPRTKGAPADQRTDIFSFGVVLYGMLVGRPRFVGDTAAEVMANMFVRDADLASGDIATELRIARAVHLAQSAGADGHVVTGHRLCGSLIV